MLAVWINPKPEAIVAPDWQAPVGPLLPDTKQVAGVSGEVALGAGSTVRLKMFMNSARIVRFICSRIRNVRPTEKFSTGCRSDR